MASALIGLAPGISLDAGPAFAAKVQDLFAKAAITGRADIKTFIGTGNLPAGSTITPAVFQRACLILALRVLFNGESEASGADTGT